jgi:hypothetical protein
MRKNGFAHVGLVVVFAAIVVVFAIGVYTQSGQPAGGEVLGASVSPDNPVDFLALIWAAILSLFR